MTWRRIHLIWPQSAGALCSTRVTVWCSAISGACRSGDSLTDGIRQAFGNWQVNGIVTLMSGTPFTVFDSTDFSVQGSAPEISGFFSNRPNLVPGQNPNSGPRTPRMAERERISTDHPGPQLTGAAIWDRRAQHRAGPRLCRLGLLRFKNIPVGEGKEFQFRAEFFNILNHTNFRLPDSDISSPTFNQILEAQPPRLIQLALKFLF